MAQGEDKFYRAHVTHREDIADDLWKIRLDPGGDFRFEAGQFATLGVRSPEKLVERAYSIVSAPHEKELELFFELVPHGELTPLLHAVPVGGEITLRKAAKGRFTLDLKSGHRNHLLLCTVTGIAPFVSYVRGDNLYLMPLADPPPPGVDREARGAPGRAATRWGAERALTTDGSELKSWGTAEFIAQEELHRFTGYWWSPDETKIALTHVEENFACAVPRGFPGPPVGIVRVAVERAQILREQHIMPLP